MTADVLLDWLQRLGFIVPVEGQEGAYKLTSAGMAGVGAALPFDALTRRLMAVEVDNAHLSRAYDRMARQYEHEHERRLESAKSEALAQKRLTTLTLATDALVALCAKDKYYRAAPEMRRVKQALWEATRNKEGGEPNATTDGAAEEGTQGHPSPDESAA